METESKKIPIWGVLLCILFGTYLTYSGVMAWIRETWPLHLGPGLDTLESIFLIFGHPTDAHMGGFFLALLGLAIIVFSIYLRIKVSKGKNGDT
jgi:hypothetical protein